jgi:DNA-binding protein H-NS
MRIQLSKLDLKQLKKLRIDVNTAIDDFEKKRMVKARAELEKTAKSLGVRLEDVIKKPSAASAKTKPIRAKTKVAAKYQNPNNPSEKWTGRGRKPKWVETALAQGATLDLLLIK